MGDFEKMNNLNLIIKEPKGFAGLIANVMMPLNDNPQFKEKFKKTSRKILINATNLNYAALLTIDKGNLKVESILNKPKSNLNKKLIGWNGYVAMDTQIFLGFATKRLSLIKLGLKVLRGEVKLRGILKLLIIFKLIKILTK
ncbi:MAG: hypothetical protein EAX89_12950 [Candidatus Lokiarchaeota archaeon]|nr:hypothetical protein [Candidatus Lokiarchaeota archaeon]